MQDSLRSVGQAAERLGVSRDSVRRLIRVGSLKAVRVASRVMVAESEIERVISQGCGKLASAGNGRNA